MKLKVLIFSLILIFPGLSSAQLGKYSTSIDSIEESQNFINTFEHRTTHKFKLKNDSKIEIISRDHFLEQEIVSELEDLHAMYAKDFGPIPAFSSKIYLMEEAEFFRFTGAPKWTNALFYRNKILVPVNSKKLTQKKQLLKTIRHEFSHAIIHSLSSGDCPGWLDEGLAQWAEGEEHHELEKVLTRWLKKNELIKLSTLQYGFTGLKKKMVAPAYAQSLYASKYLINSAGKEKIGNYFSALRKRNKQAFQENFGFNQHEFQKQLKQELKP